jgi:hypothetical protein
MIRPPEDLSAEELRQFTSDFSVPFIRKMHFHSAGFDYCGKTSSLHWPDLNAENLSNLSLLDIHMMCHYAEAIPSLVAQDFRGKRILVLGSSRPWLELFILKSGALEVLTVEYREIKWNISKDISCQWSSMTYNNLCQSILHSKLCPEIDTVISYSSIEHSGLGRYGDPISPDGDLETLANIRKFVSSSASYFIAVPVGDDAILFNRHRVYGAKRLRRLAEVLGRSKVVLSMPDMSIAKRLGADLSSLPNSIDSIISSNPIGADGTQVLLRF